uniref:prephenate dehydratase n=1 Tax=Guillardia theta TaxID=55529 RepID=A0A7S4K5S5_GUITH
MASSRSGVSGLLRMTARISSKEACSTPIKPDAAELRKTVEDCDEALVLLLHERARALETLWSLEGPADGIPSAELSPSEMDRVKQAHSCCKEEGRSSLSDSAIVSVFQELSRVCSQIRDSVAYLGPPATFTHQAARSRFGLNAIYLQCDRIPDVFQAVERGKVGFGVAPVENSTEGAISQTLDLLATTELQVVAEVCLDIRHNMLSNADLHRIQRVFSHPQALAQCRGWLQANLPGAEIIAESSTARAAQLAAQAKPEEGIAAISSLLASELYDLPVKATSIQDLSNNMTRFVVVRQQSPGGMPDTQPTGDDKTMLVLCMADRVGALHDVLHAFQQRSVNLARIESRPSKSKAWEYIFFVDMHGHYKDENIQGVLLDLKQQCSFVRVLGSFPFIRQPSAHTSRKT